MKPIDNKYAVKSEVRFDENTKLYMEFGKQFQAVEKSFDNACQSVKNKILNLLNAEFPADEGWIVAHHSEFIRIYKTSWGNGLHFEIGTWAWQKIYKNISFNRLISYSVEIQFCLHTERARTEKFKTKFKDIETRHDKLFCMEKYNLSDEEKCLSALNEIIARLHKIKLSIAPTIDKIINEEIMNKQTECVVLPNDANATEIPERAYCANLLIFPKIKIADNIEQIGKQAFSNQTRLCEVDLSAKATFIGHSAFYNCTRLNTVKLSPLGFKL